MQTCPSCGEENPARFRLCGFCGAALAPAAPAMPAQEVRKTVTLIFVDLKGSTSLGEHLDPEALHEVKERYFNSMAAEITRHGGKIEKYIGDAIMAVFGLPRAHEDDALRAVRAASGMQAALAGLNRELRQVYGVTLANRTGVNTGEVVANVDPGADQKLATGDAVNVTARLEQAAPENEILLGEVTYSLVRDAVDVEPVEPLELKGKAERVPAYRLVSVRDRVVEGRARRDDAPMVGRTEELRTLEAAFEAAVDTKSVRMATIIGDAGVGKSRLIREFVGSVEGRADVVRGRCLPYGEGITFWPLLEIVREAAGIREEDPTDTARAKLLALVDERDVAARVASMAGLTPAQFPLPELFWGARRFLESLAARRPLVAVVDDIHWAEPAFLDLLVHVLETAVDAPIVLLCSARPDLLEARPDWGGQIGSGRIVLEPLSEADASRIVENLLGNAGLSDEVRRRIVHAAEGNPLFVEQMLSMLIETGALRFDDGRWVRADETAEIAVPPTIQALLAARLDKLSREERAVIQPAAVIGVQFAQPAVTELAPEAVRPNVADHLGTLTRKQLLRPEDADATPGGGADATYRFGHVLVRDAAYQGLLKRARASLHERFVAWADQVNADRDRQLEFEEILGYHLEQAYRYLAELGPVDDHGRAVGSDAANRLSSAARRASLRGDVHAAANLYRRAADLLPALDPLRIAMLPELGDALWELGELDAADAVLDEAIRAGEELWDDRAVANARLVRLFVRNLRGESEGWSALATEEAATAIPLFEAGGNDAGLVRAYRLLTWVHGTACRYGDAVDAATRMIEAARRADDRRREFGGSASFAMAAYYGPTAVDEAIERCEAIASEVAADRGTQAIVLSVVGQLSAMKGEFDRARELLARARAMLDELGRNVIAASLSTDSWRIEMLAGDPGAAERDLLRDYATLERMGEQYFLSTLAGALAHVVYAQGRLADAERHARTAQQLSADDDIVSQLLWRSALAKVLSHERSSNDEALALAQSAVDLMRRTDAFFLADALADYAEVARRVEKRPEAAAARAEAVAIYSAKGDRISASRLAGAGSGETSLSETTLVGD